MTTEVMYRAFGYNESDMIIHYDKVRHTLQEAQDDLEGVLAIDGVFSAAVEMRTVVEGSVTYDEQTPDVVDASIEPPPA